MALPKISFVIPCFNYGRYLRDCLDGIFSQTRRVDFEIILVDDCSTDDTRSIIESLDDSRIRKVFHEVNRGHVVTINEGVTMAKGELIARIDPDDRYRPEFLARVLPVFERNPRVGLVCGRAAMIDGTGKITHLPPVTGRVTTGAMLVELLRENFVTAPTTVATREAWNRSMPIPAGLAYSDWYLNLQMARRFELGFVDDILADYRVHSANHHSKIIRDRTDEESTFKILDRIYAEKEPDPALERKKQLAKASVYCSHYTRLVHAYFGERMREDSRRCYRKAFLESPLKTVFSKSSRYFLGSFLKPENYSRLKKLIPVVWRADHTRAQKKP